MTTDELKALDLWIAELMEAKPTAVPLNKVRKVGDERFNYARQHSAGGWWICDTGTDAEDKRGIETPCAWYPASNIASEPDQVESQSAALLVLSKCAVGSPFTHLTQLGDRWIIYRGPDEFFSERVEAPTLPEAICLFAKSTFK